MTDFDTIRDALDARETAEMYLRHNKDNLDGLDAQILARQTVAALDRLEAQVAKVGDLVAFRNSWEARAVAAEQERDEARESESERMAGWQTAERLLAAAESELDALRDELAALQDKFDHLESEWVIGRDRGDSVVYRDEREAFDKWQRSGGESRVVALEEALRDLLFFAQNVPLTDASDPYGEGREIRGETVAAARAALADAGKEET